MAFHCGAPTRDGSACQRHVREPGTRCSQHRNLGGPALRLPRLAMRTITLADPALTEIPTVWATAGTPRDRVRRHSEEESEAAATGRLDSEKREPEQVERSRQVGPEDESADPGADHGRAAQNGAAPKGEDVARAQPVERPPLLRKERALDPDWIGARPLFRDEAPKRPAARIEFEPSEGTVPRPPRIAPLRSVVLNPQTAAPEADPPTLIDRMPPIDPDDLVVPDFLRPDFAEPKPPLPQRKRRPWPIGAPRPLEIPDPEPDLDPPVGAARPLQVLDPDASVGVAKPLNTPDLDPDPPTLIDPHPPIAAPLALAPDDIAVPDFIVPGFSEPAPKPPLRTVLSTVLGPDLWQRCYAEWSAAHCTALARIARTVDGLAPSAGTAVRSTAGAGMRWLGVARERELLADQVADAISHPAGATAANQARTVRLYGAAICVALNLPLRRCACHRDLERDVSGALIRLGLEELAGEVP